MTTENNRIEPGSSSEPILAQPTPTPEPVKDIVSVNKQGTSDNKVAKGVFILVVGAVMVSGIAWFSQDWLNARKAQMKASVGPRAAEETAQVFNPEKTGARPAKPSIGVESGRPAPSQTAEAAAPPAAAKDEEIRALRGADGKVMLNAQGRALGVDKAGNVIEVPAITAMGGEQTGRKPLPGAGATGRGQQAQGGDQPQPKPPSRYGGSLFVGGEPAKPATVNSGRGADGGQSSQDTLAQTQQVADILRNAGLGGAQPAASASGFAGPAEQGRPGTVGTTLYASATPDAIARRMKDQNLILPKGRQADCILTGRIVDEVAGFTSCVLAQNLYSDNGRVLLLERGSQLTGEYGVTNQLGLERLFVTWSRLRTPEGIEVDLSSPGADRLGTSGVPGHLDNRWASRIGAAFLLSFVKDISVAVINAQMQRTHSGSGTAVNVQTAPGQNTMNASSALAEEVIKQTLKVRPRLTINEGDRISIYVARDLDFTPVYALKTASAVGTTRLLAK